MVVELRSFADRKVAGNPESPVARGKPEVVGGDDFFVLVSVCEHAKKPYVRFRDGTPKLSRHIWLDWVAHVGQDRSGAAHSEEAAKIPGANRFQEHAVMIPLEEHVLRVR